jgi:RecJ-like exonuclease
MSLTFTCPECQGELLQVASLWHCEHCHGQFIQTPHCDQCGSVLDVLKACGAVDYFCNQCNEMKSKRLVDYRYEKQA